MDEGARLLMAFHNLEVEEDPSEWTEGPRLSEFDKRKIKAFLREHAPEIFVYQTARSLPKSGDFMDIIGSLGHYEHENGLEWFKSEEPIKFIRSEYWPACRLIEGYFQGVVSSGLLAWLKNRLGQQQLTLSLHKEGQHVPWSEVVDQEEIDLAAFEIRSIGSSVNVLAYGLAIGPLLAHLHTALLQLLEGKLDGLGRCAHCGSLFEKSRRNARYCDKRCSQASRYQRWRDRGGLEKRNEQRKQRIIEGD